MRRLVGIIAATAALSAPAFAADIARPVYKAPVQIVQQSFAGFYAGIHGGYGWSEDSMTIMGTEPIGAAVVATGAVPGSVKTEGRGWMLGGALGYNWQVGAVVFGAEASINWSDLSGSQSQTLTLAPLGLPVSLTTTGTQELEWYGRLTGRVGFVAFDRALIYFDGGAAYGGVKNTASIALNAPAPIGISTAATSDDSKFGWTIGAGVEVALEQGWRVLASWEYMDFGSETLALPANVAGVIPVGFQASQDNTFHVAKIGLRKGF